MRGHLRFNFQQQIVHYSNATSVRLDVPNHGEVDSEKIGGKKTIIRLLTKIGLRSDIS
jgi:hypothetical protein